ncbi:MAG: hypothetical protein A2751_01165 [Candidatus Doudnabacteria bacterium RIFCSPHIGHO2_01_FULL_46_14]|uniref:Ribbon-helix-helix protein CopG domain-containing protein n=1 Tax=Candidatus Doudnabacteria bacterium RIFCSPHIGHO2_01_FULL_46_14 TaxID=1817824 RepID=A0A1F5NMZ2_9BACT|nr:MAG: hypothetical protein A2751_01165 [Candidatus Doudnabacteria bacterium RIFCSPHIGHO2_01_FULL_46_14]
MSISDDQFILLEKVSKILLGTYNFRDLARQSVALVVKELKNQGLVAAGVFRVLASENKLSAYAYSTKYSRVIDKILPARFSELSISLAETKNLAVKAAVTDQIQQSRRLADFSSGVLADDVTNRVQRFTKTKLGIAFPIHSRSGRVAGVILFAVTEEKLSGEQMALFQTFANQLGLAFSNAIAFEKLMHQYKQKSEDVHDHDNEPSIKFTLRITPREDKRLEELARNRGITKAELIRELLDKI